MPRVVLEQAREVPVLVETDVVVTGGGVSGFAAAVSAARAGARTVLLERGGYLGGVAASGLMTSMTNCIMTADGGQVVRGIV